MKNLELQKPPFGKCDITRLQYLIVGTPRSGTGFMSQAFTAAGLPCGHEKAFTLGRDRRCVASVVESSWLSVPFLEEVKRLKPDVKIIHVIRNPMSTYRSLIRLGFYIDYDRTTKNKMKQLPKRSKNEKRYQDFMNHFIPFEDGLANFVIEWNKIASKSADYTHFLWDSIDNLFEKMGERKPKRVYRKTNYNTTPRWSVDVDLVIEEDDDDISEIERLAKLYESKYESNFYKEMK